MVQPLPKNAIVVGIDEGQSHRSALDWAATRAQQLRRPLVLLHALDDTWAMPEYAFYENLTTHARTMLQKAAEHVREFTPSVQVSTQVEMGSVTSVMGAVSAQVELIVVGGHRPGVLGGLVPGTTSLQVATRSLCSVAVIPTADLVRRSGVVVGVDGSDQSLEAVAIAAREADRLGEELHVVYSFTPPDNWVYSFIPNETFLRRMEEAEEVVLSESVAGLGERYPDLVISKHLDTHRFPAEALLAAADKAQLLVLGSRGRGVPHNRYLGSVSHKALLWLPCATFVWRNPQQRQQPGNAEVQGLGARISQRARSRRGAYRRAEGR